jgi:hypothetical protein
MREYLARAFGCDLRSLAAFRIALGILLLADIAWRLPWFDVWLTETGAWPIAAAQAETPRGWSLYFLSGSAAWAVGLLTSAGAAAIALIAGWRTRWATVLSWILLVSLQTRNVLPLNAGDIVLRLLLFWGVFLPLGARWSVDARAEAQGGLFVSVGTAALLIQVALIYVFNALYKTGEAWKAGTAIEVVLQQETYTTALAPWLLEWPRLLRVATHGTWWFELLGPFLAFFPWRTSLARGLVAFGFIGFHLALFATLRIGLFPLICIAAWLPFIPGGFWDAFRRRDLAPVVPSRSKVFDVLAGMALAIVLVSNVLGFAGQARPAWLRLPANVLRLDQQWSLFAPDPGRTEGWMVVVIETADGKEYDALTGAEVDWARPAHLGAVLPSGQWRKYLAAVRSQRFPNRARVFANFHLAQWQRLHPGQQVTRVRLHYLWEWLATRQSPPDNWFIFEKPPGPLTEVARQLGYPVAPPVDSSDL